MAVPEQTPYKEYTANGVTKIFPLEFDVLEQDHLIVLVNDLEPSVGSWSLDAENDTVVFALPPANGANIKIRRDTPLERPNDYGNYNATLKPTTVNTDFDNIWRKLQEMGVLNWMIDNNIKDLNEYVDSLNDETKAIFLQMIQEQGTSLEQLDAYVDQLYKNLAEVAVGNGWFAEFVADGEENQKQINDKSTRSFNSINELLEYLPRSNEQTVIVKSRFPPNFGLNSPYAGGGQFQWLSSSTVPENNGTIFKVPGINIGRWHRVYDTDVCASWFAGHGWTNEDKTNGVQQAIDFANDINNASALCIDGKYKITSSLFIDRKTDTTKGEFIIYATGNNNGFLIDSPITMFSSRLPYNPSDAPAYTKAPCSEATTFRGVDFEATTADLNNCIFDDKFLRLTFDSCTHRKMRGCKSAEFLQSVKWIGKNKFRQHVGYFIDSVDAYDVRVQSVEFENSGSGFRFSGIARGCNFTDSLYQGSAGPFVAVSGLFGGSISRNYFEANGTKDIILGIGGGVSSGEINANIHYLHTEQLEDANYYPVDIGLGRNITISNCLSNGNIAFTSNASSFEITSFGNTTPPSRRALSHDATEIEIITPVPGGNQSTALKIRNFHNVVSTSISEIGAVKLPKLDNASAQNYIVINNQTSIGVNIYPAEGERILGVGYDLPYLLGSGSIKLAKTKTDYWVIV